MVVFISQGALMMMSNNNNNDDRDQERVCVLERGGEREREGFNSSR